MYKNSFGDDLLLFGLGVKNVILELVIDIIDFGYLMLIVSVVGCCFL